MDIAWIGGEEGAEHNQRFSCAVARGMEERRPRHVEGVFEAGVPFWVLRPKGQDGADVVGGVAAHVADADGQAVTHADHAELGDGVLFEELGYEFGGVAEGEQVAGGAEVFFRHGEGEVQD